MENFTMEKLVSINWVASNLMVGADSKGSTLVMGGWQGKEPADWKGLSASDMLMLAAAGCSTYDLSMILTKQREPLEGIEVTVKGTTKDEAPHNFTKMHIHYKVKGNVSEKKVATAIKLSDETYCSVINSLRPTVEFELTFEIIK